MEIQTPLIEARRVKLDVEVLDSEEDVFAEDVIDDADAQVVPEREVDVLRRDEIDRKSGADGAANGESEEALAGGKRHKRGREHRPSPALGIAEECPGPFAGSDAGCGNIGEFRACIVVARGHQVQKPTCRPTERRPVEIVVSQEPRVLDAASAIEPHAVNGRVCSTGKPFEPAEVRQRNARLLLRWTREYVPPGERVVHGRTVIDRSDDCLERNARRSALVLDQRMNVVALETLPAVQEREVDDEGNANDLPAELLDQPSDRLDRAAGGEHVVVDEHPNPLPER